ncbi:pyridoxal-phosphate dependent enzyme [Acinetobacter pittii]|uniref:1-aminocyclopropane-1-carboxylate deaminase/D-cysteine desulfhydrase n=1 Tax=Acinetobacter pittii TaxID=48296 RepID=UPI00197CC42F|nr:pyridoxal-phosphate dependent enzyme [Acinetobacter pittii]MBN6523271.1 pyridoxal-phosphate dependent enzyme [Acinetobacter pittii]
MNNLEALENIPRLDLRGFTSPVQHLKKFSEAIGVEVWCKRDDIGSVGLAGNKVRKLEVELAYAISTGATHLVAEGSRLSNATRAVAAASALLGLKCTLILSHEEPHEPVGNLMLDGLFGANLEFVGDVSWQQLSMHAEAVVNKLKEVGEKVYRLPIGCASERSCLGFTLAYAELQQQMKQHNRIAETIIHASSSGGTHAGLILGNALSGFKTNIKGIVVAENVYPDIEKTYLSYAQGAAKIINANVELSHQHINITQDYLGEGYGLFSEGIYEAIDLLATKEGLLVDPVYSGKAVAAIIDLASKREIKGPVVFWHTGGYHALFDPTYAKRIWGSISRLSKINL